DAVPRLEGRQLAPGQAGRDARVAVGQVGIVEKKVALGAADVYLIAEEVVGDAVGAVAMDDDQAKSRLLPRPDHGGGAPCHRSSRLRTRGQRVAGQPSPTVLAEEDVVPVRVSAPPALGHVEGVCKRRNPLITGGPVIVSRVSTSVAERALPGIPLV